MKNIIIGIFLVFLLFFGCTGGIKPATGINAKIVASGIEISWTPSQSADVTGYNIYRSESNGVLGNKINPVLVTSSSYVDANIVDGKTYYYTVKAFANGAEDSNNNQVSITASISPPSLLSIQINQGASYTVDKQVSLGLYAKGAANCRYSNDGTNWSPWSSYITQKLWTLSDGEGEKAVYYQCQNSAELVSDSVNAKIIYKTSGPLVTVLSPEQDDVLGTKFEIDGKVSGGIGRINCSANIDGSWVATGDVQNDVPTKIPIILNDGRHSMYVTCSDEVGATKTNTINFETEENPISFKINDGASHTGSLQVTLEIYGPSANECRLSNDGVTWSAWSAFSPTKTWTLASGNGQKNIYLECQTSAGTSLGIVSDSIIYQNIPTPDVSVSINNGETTTYSTSVQLGIYAPYASACRYSENQISWTSWKAYSSTQKQWFSLKAVDGIHTVYVQCENQYGNIGESSASILLKQNSDVPTKLSILINDGAGHTSSSSVTLTLDARLANECRYMNDGGSWSSWDSFTRKKSWDLGSGAGTKTVYYQCRNDIGLSSTAKASIILDGSTPPVVTITYPTQNELATESTIYLKFRVSSSQSYVTCVYTCNGQEHDTGNVPTGQENTKTLVVEGENINDYCGIPGAGSVFTTSVRCTDSFGNVGYSDLIAFSWSKWVGPLI